METKELIVGLVFFLFVAFMFYVFSNDEDRH